MGSEKKLTKLVDHNNRSTSQQKLLKRQSHKNY